MTAFSGHPGHGSAGKTIASEGSAPKKPMGNPAKAPGKAASAVKGNFTGLV